MNNLAESKEIQDAINELFWLEEYPPGETFKEKLNNILARLSKAQNLDGLSTIVIPQLTFMNGRLKASGLELNQIIKGLFSSH